jgi:hypothetical protein
MNGSGQAQIQRITGPEGTGKGVGSRAEGVEDRLVPHAATTAPGQPVCGCLQHLANQRGVQLRRSSGNMRGFDERGAVERARGAADVGDEEMAGTAQQLAQRAPVRTVLGEVLLDHAEAHRQVVPVVAITQGRVEAGQICLVTADHTRTTTDVGDDGIAVDRLHRPSVWPAPCAGNDVRPAPANTARFLPPYCWLLAELAGIMNRSPNLPGKEARW